MESLGRATQALEQASAAEIGQAIAMLASARNVYCLGLGGLVVIWRTWRHFALHRTAAQYPCAGQSW